VHEPARDAVGRELTEGGAGPQAALPYVAPYALFAIVTWLGNYLPNQRPLIYAVKTLVVGAVLWACRRAYTEVRPRASMATLVAAGVGVAVIVAWVGLDPYYPQSGTEWRVLAAEGLQRFDHPEKLAAGFDPFRPEGVLPPWLAIGFRLLGAVVVVPVFEELFWRSWLIRVLVADRFRTVPVGTFTWGSFLITVAGFGLTHREWLAGLICGAALNLLLYWRKDLFACIVAHAVANAALAAWVLSQRAWQFW